MKRKARNFIMFMSIVITIAFICLVANAIGKYESNIWQSKAIIAQMQPDIIAARSQATLNSAIATQLFANTMLLLFLILFPYVLVLLCVIAGIVYFAFKIYGELNA